MRYDFTSILDRHGKDVVTYDNMGAHIIAPTRPKEGFDIIPMWVADMNFPVVPTITEAIIARAQHPSFGYFLPTDKYCDSIVQWHEKHNGVTGLTKEHTGYKNGMLGGVVNALNVLRSRGDNVLVHSPTYSGFTFCLTNAGYSIVLSPLVQGEQGIWRIGFRDMEKKIMANYIHTALFCSPYNPAGRVWERWELEKAMEIFQQHGAYIISDETWSDVIRPGQKHIPTQMVNSYAKEHTVALYAPSKTFNLAGLIGSYHTIYSKQLRDRVDKESSLCRCNEINVLFMHTLIDAYKPEGYGWVDELNQILANNVDFAYGHIQKQYKDIQVTKPRGTYMPFLDYTKWCEAYGKTIEELQKTGSDVGVAWQDDRRFHGPRRIRANLVLPLSHVQGAFARLNKHIFNA